MGSHEKKMHLVDMSSLSILFKVKSGVSHSCLLRNATSSLDLSFKMFFPAWCTKHTINHNCKIALILELFKCDPTRKFKPKPKVNRPENMFLF